jgi:hypothetical protein
VLVNNTKCYFVYIIWDKQYIRKAEKIRQRIFKTEANVISLGQGCVYDVRVVVLYNNFYVYHESLPEMMGTLLICISKMATPGRLQFYYL